jgi:hypothetical protein
LSEKKVFCGEIPVEIHSGSGSFDGHFCRNPSFHQAESNTAHNGHVLGGVIFSDARGIFSEEDIQPPMEGIFYPPMSAYGMGKLLGITGEA